MPTERRFFDTSIFVASFNEIDQRRRGLARGLIREALQGDVVISPQVADEFLEQALRRFNRPMDSSQAHEYLRVVLQPLCQGTPSIELHHDALNLADRWRLAWRDAGILAAATRARCRTLLTAGPMAGQQFGSVRAEDPFA